MEQATDKRIGTTSTIRAFHNSELELRISDKQAQGYELVDQGYDGNRIDGSRWWAKLRYVGIEGCDQR